MADHAVKIGQYADNCQAETVDFWRDQVNFQGCAKETSRMTALLQLAKNRLDQEGSLHRILPSGDGIPVFSAAGACGAKGSGAHTMEECAIADTFFQRTKLIARMITDLEEELS